MSVMKRVIDEIMDLWSCGIPIAEIAKQLQVPYALVQDIVEEYSNFYN